MILAQHRAARNITAAAAEHPSQGGSRWHTGAFPQWCTPLSDFRQYRTGPCSGRGIPPRISGPMPARPRLPPGYAHWCASGSIRSGPDLRPRWGLPDNRPASRALFRAVFSGSAAQSPHTGPAWRRGRSPGRSGHWCRCSGTGAQAAAQGCTRPWPPAARWW